MYGPTVVITTFADSAMARSDAGSVASAMSRARSAWPSASRSRTASSLAWLRPASAHRVSIPPAPAARARYSAVSPPVNPVAPNRTMSYSRSAMGGVDLPRQAHRLVELDTSSGGQPAGDGRRDALGGVGGLAGEVEDGRELVLRGGSHAELVGVGGQPIGRVHRVGSLV